MVIIIILYKYHKIEINFRIIEIKNRISRMKKLVADAIKF